ncbi:unnamed protein product [Gongylonema pulchrum]|uniref:Sulfatase domain-containing protein n=1 Tax=Gongylonema pulchrum TaxID=637853 RepID=A0A183EMB9_9BILA|nr:unnamed protein product [Gongylonema pulchrum]
MYAENHGFGADYMWDREKNRAFRKGVTNSTDNKWWWSGDIAPAWYTAGKSNIDVHCYWIPGCDLPFRDMIVRVPRERKYSGSDPEQTNAVESYFPEIVERIVKYQSYKQQFFLLRYAGVQAALETFGRHSGEAKQALKAVDHHLLQLQVFKC